MTIQRFQSIVLRLANQMPVRYFLLRGPSDNPASVMGLQFFLFPYDTTDSLSRLHVELAEQGFKEKGTTSTYEIWEVDRTTESGEPYVSQL